MCIATYSAGAQVSCACLGFIAMASPEPAYVRRLHTVLEEILARLTSIEQNVQALDVKLDRQISAQVPSGSDIFVDPTVSDSASAMNRHVPTEVLHASDRIRFWANVDEDESASGPAAAPKPAPTLAHTPAPTAAPTPALAAAPSPATTQAPTAAPATFPAMSSMPDSEEGICAALLHMEKVEMKQRQAKQQSSFSSTAPASEWGSASREQTPVPRTVAAESTWSCRFGAKGNCYACWQYGRVSQCVHCKNYACKTHAFWCSSRACDYALCGDCQEKGHLGLHRRGKAWLCDFHWK